jgi:hypothetical protein
MPGDATSVSLSRPSRRRDAENRSEHDARVLRRALLRTARSHHLGRAAQQPFDVEALQRRRHHAEVRQRRVPPADAFDAWKDGTECVGACFLLELRSGIGDGDEMLAGLLPHDGASTVPEVRFEDARLERRTGLAGDHVERARWVATFVEGAHLRRIGGIEHREARESGLDGERHGQHFRAQARAAHAEQQDVLEAGGAHFGLQAAQRLEIGTLLGGDSQPTQPTRFVGAGPQAGVAGPQAARAVFRIPALEAGIDCGREARGARVTSQRFQCAHRSSLLAAVGKVLRRRRR